MEYQEKNLYTSMATCPLLCIQTKVIGDDQTNRPSPEGSQ